jgi:outer membrane receptor protein involved in Fe transport
MYIKNRLLFILVIISFLFISEIYSQGKISGKLTDTADYKPIEGATVILYKSDSTPIMKGMYSGEKGFFAFDSLKYGKYRIEISLIGYNVLKINNIVISENNANVKLGDIYLRTSPPTGIDTLYVTKEIVIEDEKPLMEFNDDKKVFNVDKLMTSRGGTAIDVLKKLPMVEVDANDNVSLRGSKNLMILIDNKPMKFASLRQLPADAIQNVEIITNPSAKYEAEGVTGILNVVLKKNENKGIGYNGYLYTNIKNNQSFNNGISLDMKKSKWSFFLYGGLGNYRYKSNNSSNVTYFSPKSFFDSHSDGNGNSKYSYGGAGIEYELKKDHAIGFDTYLNKSNYDNSYFSRNNNYDLFNTLSSYYSNINSGNGDNTNINGSLYYNGKFDKLGKELNLDISYSNMNNEYNNSQNMQYYDSLLIPVNNTPSVQLNTNKDKFSNFRIQLDYTNPFNEKSRLEAGYKGIFRNNDNEYSFDTINYTVNSFVRNNDITNHFKLSDNINAIYGTFSQKIKMFRFKIGIRVEHTYTKGELVTNGTQFTKNYLDLFPTLSISQKFGLSNEIQLSYSRRITRPNIYRLNPFVRKSNAKFISNGNPELSPEYSDSYELSYIFISDIINITPVAFYRKSYDIITSYSYIKDTNITYTTYRNSSSGYSYGTDFIISSRALKWWNINSTFSFYKSKYEDNSSSAYSSEEGFSWKANIRSFFTIGDLFNLEIYY